MLCGLATPLAAQSSLRLALYHTGLGRDGPGILLRDIRRDVADVVTARDAITALAPDILVLLDMDWDLEAITLDAFAEGLAAAGHAMPHRFNPRPNAGMATGLDLDGDGRFGTADDAQGWARFAGSGGMALLSRWPIDTARLTDHTAFLWRDLPDARLPQRNGQAFPNAAVFDVQRLASVAAWEVPVRVGEHALTVMAYHAGPPAFGGAENRNFNRNADETAFWRYRLDGRLGPPPTAPFVLMGDANLDPDGGDGNHAEIRALLTHPALQDPRPLGSSPVDGAQSPVTAHWPDGPGALRVEYALPSAALRVLASGLIWPSDEARHAIVWLDIAWPP
ncbi:endonuclease/exonuclease/phosphatase family protein [Pararhodobacter sp.]|uniref:endonuclease/exonuclease/phosphatase family protein n=1 Tax=Pararhodobacter sp. TaxID=2127056 RepID=UPI002B003D6C|nr:endonuclease/exonuclease/phosphatase family protein [Pararhodobacter sp.]